MNNKTLNGKIFLKIPKIKTFIKRQENIEFLDVKTNSTDSSQKRTNKTNSNIKMSTTLFEKISPQNKFKQQKIPNNKLNFIRFTYQIPSYKTKCTNKKFNFFNKQLSEPKKNTNKTFSQINRLKTQYPSFNKNQTFITNILNTKNNNNEKEKNFFKKCLTEGNKTFNKTFNKNKFSKLKTKYYIPTNYFRCRNESSQRYLSSLKRKQYNEELNNILFNFDSCNKKINIMSNKILKEKDDEIDFKFNKKRKMEENDVDFDRNKYVEKKCDSFVPAYSSHLGKITMINKTKSDLMNFVDYFLKMSDDLSGLLKLDYMEKHYEELEIKANLAEKKPINERKIILEKLRSNNKLIRKKAYICESESKKYHKITDNFLGKMK